MTHIVGNTVIPEIMSEEVNELEVLLRIRKREYDGEKYGVITELIDDVIVSLKDLIFEELIATDEKLIGLDREHCQTAAECERLYELIEEFPDFIFGNTGEFPDGMDAILESDSVYTELKKSYAESKYKESALISEIERYSDRLINDWIVKIKDYAMKRI